MNKDIMKYNLIDEMIENYDTVEAEYKKIDMKNYSKYTLFYAFIDSLIPYKEHLINRESTIEKYNYYDCIRIIIDFIIENQENFDLVDEVERVVYLFGLEKVIIGLLFGDCLVFEDTDDNNEEEEK